MKGTQVTRAVLRSSTTPPSFLLPAFTNTAARVAISTGLNTAYRAHPAIRSLSTTSRSKAADKPTSAPSTAARDAPEPAPANASTTDSPSMLATPTPRHSSQDISNPLDSILASSRANNRLSNARWQQDNGGRSASGAVAHEQGRLARSMGLSASSEPGAGLTPSWASSYRFSAISPPPPPVRLDAYVGRGEEVSKTRNLATAMRNMEMKLRMNRVASEAAKQRFHERPGLKRKRLKSSRWRARFRIGFKATVQKVKRMKAMGW